MSDLSNTEKRNLEKLFGMSSGYVFNFSNRTFDNFVHDCTGRNIYDAKYGSGSGSKANRLRAFWAVEPNHVVAKLLGDLLAYASELGVNTELQSVFEVCQRSALRLGQNAPVAEIEAITPNSAERDFAALTKQVREAIEKNEPESGLDRLHTFAVKYLRVLCRKHGISAEKDKPLHSLVGEYVKRLKEKGLIESDMTERILKSSISTFEAFNRVRNDQSFTHDNPILNYDESLLIFNHVASSIRFVESIERRTDQLARQTGVSAAIAPENEIPF